MLVLLSLLLQLGAVASSSITNFSNFSTGGTTGRMPSEKRLSSHGNKPLGLGTKKKSRSIEDVASDHSESEQKQEREEKGLYFELDADADQIDELEAMFDTAEAVLDEPEKSIPLFRGVIHECNALFGNNQDDEEKEGFEEHKQFPARFYRIFAEALFNLAIMENLTDAKAVERSDFLKAALDKVDDGLNNHPSNASLLQSKATIMAALAANGEDFYALKLSETLSDCLNVIKDVDGKIDFLERIFDTHLEAVDAKSTKKVVEVLLSVFEDFLGDDVEEDTKVHLLKVSFINALAETELELEEDTREINNFLSKTIEHGEEHLLSKQDSKSDLKGQLVVSLGESYMLLSSVKALQDDEVGELELSQKAVDKFELAESEYKIDLAPSLKEFIENVKNPKTESGSEEFTVVEN